MTSETKNSKRTRHRFAEKSRTGKKASKSRGNACRVNNLSGLNFCMSLRSRTRVKAS